MSLQAGDEQGDEPADPAAGWVTCIVCRRRVWTDITRHHIEPAIVQLKFADTFGSMPVGGIAAMSEEEFVANPQYPAIRCYVLHRRLGEEWSVKR